ncbi:MAG: hypothetical protein ACOC56_01660 [Atribacterota bacterium]
MLRIQYTKKHGGVTFKGGQCYTFSYNAYENDPNPLVFFMYAIVGINPKTGHQWRLIQCINLNYIPRGQRKLFVSVWKNKMAKSKSVKLTWEYVIKNFPFMKNAIRRYMLKPNYYIRKVKYIPPDKYEEEIIKSWAKDFSGAIKRGFFSTIKKWVVGSRR